MVSRSLLTVTTLLAVLGVAVLIYGARIPVMVIPEGVVPANGSNGLAGLPGQVGQSGEDGNIM
ncbi:MAG: hypothetical protein LBQ12_08870 [Deltaproteobacteria bacterium]|nr:hypothetical protein [Deltaproteobacteria bacterium]